MADGWHTPPFEPVEKDGKIYARGATDDKGQLFIHVKALESYLKTAGSAPVNIKFLIEGEEEVSSPNLVPFIKEHLDLLMADVCVISDTSMRTIDEPAILQSLRGMTYLEVELYNADNTMLGTAFAGVVAVTILSLFITSTLVQSSIPDDLVVQINFDDVDFVTNEQLESYLSEETTATADQVAVAIDINEEARLRALKTSFLILAALSLLAIVPAIGLPNYVPKELPDLAAEP